MLEGYIQTRGNSTVQRKKKQNWVQVAVPPGYVVMVSLVHVFLIPDRLCEDSLELYVQGVRDDGNWQSKNTDHEQATGSTWNTQQDLINSSTADTQRTPLYPADLQTCFTLHNVHGAQNRNSSGSIENGHDEDSTRTGTKCVVEWLCDDPEVLALRHCNGSFCHVAQRHALECCDGWFCDDPQSQAIDTDRKTTPKLTKLQWRLCGRSRRHPKPSLFSDIAAVLVGSRAYDVIDVPEIQEFRLLFTFHKVSSVYDDDDPWST